MSIAPFALERYFGLYEFKSLYLLSASDCESLSLADLLALADADSRERWERLRLGYTESQGDPALRAAIASGYAAVQSDEVVVLVPEEGIFLAMHVLLEAGQHVIAMHPAYQSLHEVARSLGCRVDAWPVSLAPDGCRWTLDLEQLASLIRPETRLLIVNFPHNPTGYVATRELFDGLLALAGRHSLAIFSDEMYRGLEHDAEARLPAVADVYEWGISLAGLSKTHAVPGLRLGWLATRMPGLVDQLVTYKDYTTICNSAASEALGLMAVRAGDNILTRNRALIRTNLAHATEFTARHPTLFRWLAPDGGSIAFPAWTGTESIDEFCQAMLTRRGVMIVPGRFFGYRGAHFRVGLGRANFAEALAQVEAALDQQ